MTTSSRERLARFLPYLVFAASPFFIYSSGMRSAGMMDGGDDRLALLPLMLHSARQFLRLELLWSPDLWMGMPLLAEPEAATLYPVRLLLLLFSPIVGCAVYIILHFVLAQATAYLYARQLDLSREAALFGAASYGYSAFMMGHRGHIIFLVAGAWAPLFLYCLHRAATESRPPKWIYPCAAVTYASVLFGGAVQLAVYLASMSLLLHAALSLFQRSARPLWVALVGLVPALLVASLQLLPSLEYASDLAKGPRESYEFATQLSVNPFLAAMLVLPINPISKAEIYVRCGTVVLAAAVTAAITWPRARPIVRAWAIVAGVALLLVMGRFVPPLARLLHALPIVGVLRGPARHGFELSLALSFLAAFGLDAILLAPTERSQRAGLAVTALGLLAFGAGTAYLLRWVPRTGDVESAALLLDIGPFLPRAFIYAGIAAALWIATRLLASRKLRGWAAFVAIGASLLESRVAAHDRDALFLSLFRTEIPSSFPEGLEHGGFARIVAPQLIEANAGSFAGDTVLYVDRLQNMNGYVSIAPREPAVLFDLDMHGHPRRMADLLFSRLPSIFGVTHVVVPELICQHRHFAMSAESSENPSCVESVALERSSFSLQNSTRACTESLAGEEMGYSVAMEARTSTPAGGPILIGLEAPWDVEPHSWARIAPPELTTEFKAYEVPLADVSRLPSFVGLAAWTRGTSPIEVRRPRLIVKSLDPVFEMRFGSETSRGSPGELQAPRLSGGARSNGDTLLLSSTEDIAQARAALSWPAWIRWSDHPRLRLELQSHAWSPASGALVADLYRDPDFDSPDAQLTVPGATLGPEWRTFRRDFRLEEAPGPLTLRVFLEGRGQIETRWARLLAERRREIDLTRAEHLFGDAYELTGDTIRFDAHGNTETRIHLPARPMTLELEVEAPEPLTAPLGFGLVPIGHAHSELTDLEIPPSRLGRRRRITRTTLLPGAASGVKLHVYTRSTTPANVLSLTAHDACDDRQYEPVRPLEGGLWLYRNPEAMPRAFTVSKLVTARDIEEAREILRDDATFDPRSAAVVEWAPDVAMRPGSVEEPRFGAQWFEAWVEASQGPTFLVVNDRYDRHWTATVDGAEVPIIRTNAIVRGVVVPGGRHRISMAYRVPISVLAGLFLAASGLLLAIFVAPRVVARLPPPPSEAGG
jgi:hypothetical protein